MDVKFNLIIAQTNRFVEHVFFLRFIAYNSGMDKTMITIGGRSFTAGESVLVIAEIGTGHGGSQSHARELIDAASDSGADCVKFQIVYADEILHPETGLVHLPGGPVRLYDRFKELEVPPDFFAEMAAYAAGKGLIFLCTPFGIGSARQLRQLAPPAIKIASPELNHYPLLKEVSGYGVPLVLSSGVSRMEDIDTAIRLTAGAPSRLLLHCVTSYPAPESDYNLKILDTLSQRFSIPVGVSDHSLDPLLIPVLSTAMGSCAVEKHITLSTTGGGLDDPVALPPSDFTRMVQAVRTAQTLDRETILENMRRDYGEDRVLKVLGSGRKELAPSEADNYLRTNRSIHAVRKLKKGHRLSEKDVALLRTEKVLRPGLPPDYLERIIGARLIRDVPDGEGIVAEDLE